MSKKYGGVNSAKTLEEMEEGEVFVKPPAHLSNAQIAMLLSLKALKLIPTVLLMGAIMWGVSFAYLKLVAQASDPTIPFWYCWMISRAL